MLSAVAVSAGRSESPRSHFDTLEVLGVPYVAYDWTGRRQYVSVSAATLFDGCPNAASLLPQLDRVAASAVCQVTSRPDIGPFALVRELYSSLGRLAAALYVEAAGSCNARGVAVLRPLAGQPAKAIDGLTARESEIARLIADGLSTKEIAQRLAISPHTVRHHIERLFDRLGVTNRAAAAAIIVTSAIPVLTSHTQAAK